MKSSRSATLSQNLLIFIAFFGISALVVWALKGILAPFVLGVIFAYFLNPLADKLHKLGFSRITASVIIVAPLTLLAIFAIALLLPLLYTQAVNFLSNVPHYIAWTEKSLANMNLSRFSPEVASLIQSTYSGLQDFTHNLLQTSIVNAKQIIPSLLQNSIAFIQVISLIVVTPVATLYTLNDWHKFRTSFQALLPKTYRDTILDILGEIDRVIAAFFRGQGTVCLFLSIFYATGLSISGLDFGFLVGSITGLFSFIPYVGAFGGFFTAIVLTLVTSHFTYYKLIAVIVTFSLGQFIEGNFLSPKLVGDRIGVHPVWMLFSLFAFGDIFGLTGIFLAVPITAVLGVMIRFAIRRYKESSFYLTPQPTAGRSSLADNSETKKTHQGDGKPHQHTKKQ